ncbi:MAG: hypothetical protein EA421_10015 [Gemmatimonadales bacterium]|nr:MAG: hypothetical protein EA421_10015 [Gemmatimonadales bacterium]
MRRTRHPDPAVEAALRYAERHGWVVEVRRGHAWGRLKCPWNDPDCRCGEFCLTSIWSTPRNPESHARSLKRVVDRCRHQPSTGDDPHA